MGRGPEQEERKEEVNWILSFISLYFLLTDVIWLANGNFNWWEYKRAPLSPTHNGPVDYWELGKGTQEDNWEKSPYSLDPSLSFTDFVARSFASKCTVACRGWGSIKVILGTRSNSVVSWYKAKICMLLGLSQHRFLPGKSSSAYLFFF